MVYLHQNNCVHSLPLLYILRIMFTVGSVGRHYRSIYRLTLDRCVNRMSTATRPKYRPQLNRTSVEYRLSIGWLSVEHQPIYQQMCVSTDTVLVSSTLGRYLIDTREIVQGREGKRNLVFFSYIWITTTCFSVAPQRFYCTTTTLHQR